jgi:hypothetical protein
MLERLDEVQVSNPFTLEEAVSSLRFYWNLARHKGETITMEIWAKQGAIVPPKELPKPTESKELYHGYAET